MLLSFEGIDGSGKSTQARLLADRLRAEGREVLFVREPGGTELSERVRSLLLDPSLHIVPFAEMLLFSAARAQLVEEQIRPALAAGALVVCDRFYDSTTAYQGGGRRLEEVQWLRAFNHHVVRGLTPARTYLLEVTPALAQMRRAGRDALNLDRMETVNAVFYERVADAYARIADEEPTRVVRLDGALPVEVLHRHIWEDVCRVLAAETEHP